MSASGRREKNIRLIIEMEDRIAQCQRCKLLLGCIRKPSLGKGDLEPDVILVFEYDNDYTSNREQIIQLRDRIKKASGYDKIYHTFLVRCQPKACSVRHSTACYIDKKLIDRELNCLLTGKSCEGIPIKPGDNDIISCLPFLMEELEILDPKVIIIFGERTGEFVLKSYGIFGDAESGSYYYNNGKKLLITSPNPTQFGEEDCQQLTGILNEQGLMGSSL